MSPWMLVNRAEAEAFKKIGDSVDFYLNHWFSLVENGIREDITKQFSPENLAERDRKNREIIFNPDVDKVWAQVDRLVGAEMSAKMREILKSQKFKKNIHRFTQINTDFYDVFREISCLFVAKNV